MSCEWACIREQIESTYLPALTQSPERLTLRITRLGEKLAVHHGVEQPVPVLLRHIGDEPRVPLAVEANLGCQTGLNKEISCKASWLGA